MGKQKKRKKLSHQKKGYNPCFVFTPETVRLTLTALGLLDDPLQRWKGVHTEKIAYAQETLQQVRQKLSSMVTSLGAMCLITFDYNEKIVISMAMQIYMLDLRSSADASHSMRKLAKCQQIAAYFTPTDMKFPTQD